MNQNFISSKTKINLMRAFAGECQTRTRYDIASSLSFKKNLYLISEIFKFTANQEKIHAEIFLNLLKECAGNHIEIDGSYPADAYDDIQKLLESSAKNELNESNIVYPEFARIAAEEGFTKAASEFTLIAEIERFHNKRFEHYSSLMKKNMLFRSDNTEKWLCLNCGHVHESSEAPLSCPVCCANQGYFIRLDEAPFTFGGMKCLD